jgi:phosphodiesterase/alkaline phosphatase D-like protein
MMALLTVSAIFLRWLPVHGLPILMLFAVSAGAAAGIYVTQRRRYSASSRGIASGSADADITAVLWTAFAGVALGGLGIGVVLAG